MVSVYKLQWFLNFLVLVINGIHSKGGWTGNLQWPYTNEPIVFLLTCSYVLAKVHSTKMKHVPNTPVPTKA